jgi:hypothetical protein
MKQVSKIPESPTWVKFLAVVVFLAACALSRAPRFWSRKRRSVNRHFFISQFPYRRAGKNPFNECVALEDHLLPYPRCSEILKSFACRKIIPRRHGPDELHESESTHELWPACRQMKGQSRSPVLWSRVIFVLAADLRQALSTLAGPR